MNSILLFLFACIPARLLLAWYSTKIPSLTLYGAVMLVMSLSFLYLYFTGSRLQAPEAGGATWWANYRLIIGLLYLAAAIYSFQGKRDLVKYPLLLDIVFGLFLFYKRHFV
jgi:xanthine/uracil permease